MKELQGLIAWVKSLDAPEQGCESLNEWLELEGKAAWSRGGRLLAHFLVWATITLISLLFGALYALVLSVPLGRTLPTASGIVVGMLIGIGGSILGWYANRLIFGRRENPLKSGRDGDALRIVAKLREAGEHKNLKRELGDHGVIELNEGASLYLRCRSALMSEAWHSRSQDDPWLEARNGMLSAMESAMDRLTVYVARKRSFSEIAPVLEEMRVAASEAIRITEQRSLQAGSAGRDLRASLSRMRELAAAEDELLQLRQSKGDF